MNRIWLTILISTIALGGAGAGELAEISMPDELSVGDKTLVLNGMGLREKMMIDVYVAGLYVEQPSDDPTVLIRSEGTTRLHMHFVYKKVTAKKLIAAWNDGFKSNSRDKMDSLAEGLEQLNGWMEDVVRGDSMVFTSTADGLEVEVKGQRKGVVPGAEFAQAFWAVFLGPSPPTGALKEGLLGGS